MTVRLLKFADRQMQGPHFHLTTVEWKRNRLPGRHRHDYSEIFWLTKGRCEHLIHGKSQVLKRGTLVLIRPDDVHSLRPLNSGESFEFTNLALSPEVFQRLRAAYPEEFKRLYGQAMPVQVMLHPGGIETVNAIMRQLALEQHSRLTLESAVLQLWKLCLSDSPRTTDEAGPDWLQVALLKLEKPEVLNLGVPGLVKIAGRSHAHVSRCCQEAHGKTPSQLVNQTRMRLAAHWLRTTSLSVLEISLECGFHNPSQFHRLFKQAHGTSPRRYRFMAG